MDDDEEIQSRTPSPASSQLNEKISVPVVPPPACSSPPPQEPQPRASNGGGGVGREDCWSESATEVLIDAWGERYVESSRGNLKQKDWQEVADIVLRRGGYSKTDVQCKNRIDTVKKKYKTEKAKIGGGGGASNWPLFDKLDGLIGPLGKSPLPSANKAPAGGKKKRKKTRKAESEDDDEEEEDDEVEELGFDSDDGLPPPRKALPAVDRKDVSNVEKGRDRSAVRVLTEAMVRFGEAYERAETAKLAQAVEMEKARMRFAKEVELQRMQFFMKAQMEISQLKKSSSGGGGTGGVTGSKHKQRRYHLHHHHRERPDGNNVVADKNASDNDV